MRHALLIADWLLMDGDLSIIMCYEAIVRERQTDDERLSESEPMMLDLMDVDDGWRLSD